MDTPASVWGSAARIGIIVVGVTAGAPRKKQSGDPEARQQQQGQRDQDSHQVHSLLISQGLACYTVAMRHSEMIDHGL